MGPWLVVLPTYNEAGNILPLCREIRARHPDLDVLVVDDASPDGTADLVREAAATDPHIHLLLRTEDRGRGRAGAAGFAWALRQGYAGAIEMDADGSHRPAHIAALLAKIAAGYDLVLGSRVVRGGEDSGRSRARRLVTRATNAYARLVLGVGVGDCNSGYRAWTRAALERVDAAGARAAGPAIVHELLYRARVAGLRIGEVPIRFVPREWGESKLGLGTLACGGLVVLRLRLGGWRVAAGGFRSAAGGEGRVGQEGRGDGKAEKRERQSRAEEGEREAGEESAMRGRRRTPQNRGSR